MAGKTEGNPGPLPNDVVDLRCDVLALMLMMIDAISFFLFPLQNLVRLTHRSTQETQLCGMTDNPVKRVTMRKWLSTCTYTIMKCYGRYNCYYNMRLNHVIHAVYGFHKQIFMRLQCIEINLTRFVTFFSQELNLLHFS